MIQPAKLVVMLWLVLVAPRVNAETSVDYLRDVRSILKARCFACHGALKQESGLRLDTGHSVRQGGESGSAIVPGQADKSLLIEKVSARDPAQRMPPQGAPLTTAQIETLKSWINQGATLPDNEQAEVDPRQHWSFQPPQRPAVAVEGASKWRRNPIDSFLDANLARHAVVPQPAAARAVLLRRVYLDLIGLPPTREELQAFLADDYPSAYDRVVDRLLHDPRHGERWARHWMDIWRYSDWYGRRHVPDVWNSAPQIWRWRDWIVRSLNADHGYDRMLREMLAADEICPEDDDAGVATGYLIRNWYALNPNDWMRSIVEHTGKAFLGLTFNCAHCHDHKYDPITQDDYFRLRAFFEPIYVRQDRVPGEADPGPFQDYSYSELRKIQRLGAVRIFDKTLDAPTWFYTGGDERNRLKDRGSIAPGVPVFLAKSVPQIVEIKLPARAWYPGLRPQIQETALADARAAIAAAETEWEAARHAAHEVPPSAARELAKAEEAFNAARDEAERTGRPGALIGRQSLLLDATSGRRVVQNGLSQLKTLDDGTTLGFELLILNDAHVNFQLAKDTVKGLTASYVGFEDGRIISYRPNSLTEFDAGRFDFASGQKRFRVTLVFETKADRCLLTVRSLADDALLVDRVPIALNGWKPVGDVTKAISFDARTGSVAVVDEIVVAAPLRAEAAQGTVPANLVTLNFEPPLYADSQDIAGIEGWSLSSFSVAPATSVVSATAANESLRSVSQQLTIARRVVDSATLPVRSAQAKWIATQSQLSSLEARIAADRAKHGETTGADVSALSRSAARLEQNANLLSADANVLAHELALAKAEAKPMSDASRAKEIAEANKQLVATQSRRSQLKGVANTMDMLSEDYSPLSPSYPKTSTGRRRALAVWMTGRDNPLTARVAVNHVWARHFHSPLVDSVTDFGRSGALPSHPELLDWLAVELMESGWSMKHLHRLIVTSDAYQRASAAGMARELDPENKLLGRMNPGRMEAEVLRDSLLYIAGRLNLRMGGQELENSEALTTFRRSLYYSIYPEQGGKSSLGELFDAPDALECYRRTRSIVPQQALALTNSDWVHELSSSISVVISHDIGEAVETNPKLFVVTAFERILTRSPTDDELQLCVEAYEKYCTLLATMSPASASAQSRASVVRALVNHNDFINVR